MEAFLKDLRYAGRVWRRHPIFTLAVVLSIALAIGANTTIFTLINAVFFPELPVVDPDSLVAVYTEDESDAVDLLGVGYFNYEDFAKESETLSGIAAYWNVPMTFEKSEGSDFLWTEMVSGNYFDVLGVEATHGRTFLPEEGEVPGVHFVTVLSHDFWQREFDGDPDVVGKTMRLSGRDFEVVGIAPEGFTGISLMDVPDLWFPTMVVAEVLSEGMLDMFLNRRETVFKVVGRLQPGATLDQVETDLDAILETTKVDPELAHFNKGRSIAVLPFSEALMHPALRDDLSLAGWLLMGIVGLVLFIACANVAALLLARSARRRTEIAVRMSLGANRPRLVRQLLTESVALALAGGVAGLALAYWLRNELWDWSAPYLPFTLDIGLDLRVLAFTFLLAVVTGVLFGLAPALRASRTDIAVTLKEQGLPVPERFQRRFGLSSSLVMVQVALSLVALIVAGLFCRTLWHLQDADPGFEADRLALVSFNELRGLGYEDEEGREFYEQVMERAAGLPQVVSTALGSYMPLVDGGGVSTFYMPGEEMKAGGEPLQVLSGTVWGDYFETMGIPILRGRGFRPGDEDTLGEEPNAPSETPKIVPVVINEAMGERFWPGEEALGQRFKIFGLTVADFEVVGIAGNSKYKHLGETTRPYLYFGPYHYRSVASMFVRTEGDPAEVLDDLRAVVREVDPKVPLVNLVTMREVLDQALWAPRVSAFLLTLFGALALVLALIGTYGVTSYLINQRRFEIGVRMALGAHRADVLQLFMRQGLWTIVAGIVVGVVAALAAGYSIAEFLRGVGASDPLTFAVAALFLAAVGALAVYVSTRRATAVEPVVVLRHE